MDKKTEALVNNTCIVCGWTAFGIYDTFLYGKVPVCSVCIANSKILIRKP